MPKLIDNYILERKIGSGQYGDVFKGYNKVNGQDIAVKCVRRESLKGKFTELLESEIKVLRTCSNENIIKLVDIKKTANNIYLILEYCNEGDLAEYLKLKKYLTEDEAVDILIQILNGFKTLVKNKIMHRDLKLANILKHDGIIKIADFGFSKLLGKDNLTNTMLGSPLNMAPEVLSNVEYSSKADIWSIGICFYELLFGRPPFTASNQLDLLKNIHKNQLKIDRNINKISTEAEDILRKMLVVDPDKRISWEELFNHKINFYQEEKIRKDLEQSLKQGDLLMNMSNFYIHNNKVIEHPAEIRKKEELNEFTANVAKNENQKDNLFSDKLFKKPQEESNINSVNSKQQDSLKSPILNNDGLITDIETQREIEIKARKLNSNRILHERNIYILLASVAEEAMKNTTRINNDIVGFLLLKKQLQMIQNLKTILALQENYFNMEYWVQFTETKDYREIQNYISKEFDVFRTYFESLLLRVLNQPQTKLMISSDPIKTVLNGNLKQDFDDILKKVLYEYCRDLVGSILLNNNQNYDQLRQQLTHVDRLVDIINLKNNFNFRDDKGIQFNFKQYYEEDDKMEIKELQKKVLIKLDQIKK